MTDDTPDGIVQDEPARPRDPLAALRLTYDPDHDDRSFIDGWNAALDAAQEAAATRPSGDEALRAALEDANRIIAMTRQHLTEDHPECAYVGLGLMNDADRAALATPSSTPDVEALIAKVAAIPWNVTAMPDDTPNIGEYEWAVSEYRDAALAALRDSRS